MSDPLRDSRFSRRKWWLWIVCSLPVWVMGRWLLVEYETTIRGFSPGCPLHRSTGLYCAGCGGTRAFFALVKGDPLLSMRMHPLLLPGVLFACAYGIARWIEMKTGRCRVRISAHTGWVLFIGVIVFGIVRNFPWWPFTLLAPH
ncbi:DUF2752 domain-containing protein [Luteolibacter pohnpeiensis]|uniref:DUF2752 domain-containing protein n=1 Tax=Luteolibacter pohnpeiensis TaxID=454153 RepID=A0A934SA80_9BACT|nr:DUF2752 domain-containing protein [Luteolibacter pohnpeiensis]MBK1881643.1 DUF2752 domain-containing protein [Luteolibacter pohnpeiensis]